MRKVGDATDPVPTGWRLEAEMTASAWLGIDIAQATLAACLLRDGRVAAGTFENTPAGFKKLASWLKKRHVAQAQVCLEATGRYGEGVSEFLHAAGHTVSVINPARLKAFAQATLTRTKTDQTDAALLAQFCQRQQPPAWRPPAPEKRALRALVRRRESLLQLRQQETNRLKSGETDAWVVGSLQAVIALLDEQVTQVDVAIRHQTASTPELQRSVALVDSIPGIGPTTAAALVAEIDFGAYPSPRQLVAQAGLNPRQRQSGTSVHGQPRLSKQGASQLRKLLYFPAITAMRFNPVIHAFADGLAERGKHKMAILCACMRKLLHLVYGVLKTGLPFDPDYQAQHAKPTHSSQLAQSPQPA
jgi:transposase